MVAPIAEVDVHHPQPRVVARAAAALEAGGLVAYPTDTFYGIGCDVFSKLAVEKLHRLKGGNTQKLLALLCPDLSGVSKYAKVSNFAYRTMRQLTPGPFTFVLEATKLVPHVMQTKQREVGIRVPQSPVMLAIVTQLGRPVVTTSATTPDGAVLEDAATIKEKLGHLLELVLDGGVQRSDPSTVVSLIGDQINVLRQGAGIVFTDA